MASPGRRQWFHYAPGSVAEQRSACPVNEVRAELSANILGNTASRREQFERDAIEAHNYIIY